MAYKEENGRMVPQRVHTVVISCQHDDKVSNEKIQADLLEHVIKHVVPAKYLDDDTIYHLNPSGRFVIGGPHGDAGLTGRKIIIDTYGGWGAHGGGAFSGKDPTKVRKSTSFLRSWNVVAVPPRQLRLDLLVLEGLDRLLRASLREYWHVFVFALYACGGRSRYGVSFVPLVCKEASSSR